MLESSSAHLGCVDVIWRRWKMRERREQGRNETPAFRGLVYICGVGGVLSDRDSKVRGKPQRQLDHMTLPRDWSPQEFFELRAASDFTGPRITSLLLTRNNDIIGPRKPAQPLLARHWALAGDRDASRRVKGPHSNLPHESKKTRNTVCNRLARWRLLRFSGGPTFRIIRSFTLCSSSIV